MIPPRYKGIAVCLVADRGTLVLELPYDPIRNPDHASGAALAVATMEHFGATVPDALIAHCGARYL
jgi:hypothetical protein